MTETKKHHTRMCMVFFVELRRGSSTLLCKAACGVPVFFGVQRFQPAKAHLIRKSRLRLPASDLALCATRKMVQTVFFGLFRRKRDFLSYMVVCSPSCKSVGRLPVSSPLAAPFICPRQRSHPKPREPVGRSLKIKKHHAFA